MILRLPMARVKSDRLLVSILIYASLYARRAAANPPLDMLHRHNAGDRLDRPRDLRAHLKAAR